VVEVVKAADLALPLAAIVVTVLLGKYLGGKAVDMLGRLPL
jgi:hypothetical protein